MDSSKSKVSLGPAPHPTNACAECLQRIGVRPFQISKIIGRECYFALYRIAHREKKKASDARWYQANRQRKSDYDARYRLAHLQKKTKQDRAWRVKNRQRKAANDKARYLANREKVQQYKRDYQIKNRERLSVEHAAYYRSHKERFKAASRKRHALKKGAEVGDVAQMSAWEKAWRSKRTVVCYWCRQMVSPTKCHVDHITPLSRGGKHCIVNLCISCARCNLSKKHKMPSEWNKQLASPTLNL